MLEAEVHQRFIKNRWTLSLAESCTGGSVASRLIAIPDCSLYLLGSIVAYSNSAKTHLLNVQPQTLETYGAVSEETAREMAQGALHQFDSDFAISTTGVAGPSGGSADKPVGTVCFAIAGKTSKILSWKALFHGERQAIIEQSAKDVLSHLLEYTL